MHRDGKPKGFFYLDHRTVDSKANIITDVFVTPGNTNDVKPYINRLDEQIAKFGFEVETVELDAGYNGAFEGQTLMVGFGWWGCDPNGGVRVVGLCEIMV